jgi:small subunit ribosomal protein S6
MKNFEVTFIVDPVLSGDEIKSTAQVYENMLKDNGSTIVHIEEMGLKQLAYPINKRSSGIYFCIEFANESGVIIDKLELALRRDERIMRFLTISLDKYGVKYNDDKRKGLIGKAQKKVKLKKEDTPVRGNSHHSSAPAPAKVAAPVTPQVVAPEAVAPVVPVAVAAIVPEVVAPVVAPEEVPVAPAAVEEVVVVNEEE